MSEFLIFRFIIAKGLRNLQNRKILFTRKFTKLLHMVAPQKHTARPKIHNIENGSARQLHSGML